MTEPLGPLATTERPMTRRELTAAKNALLKDYRAGNINDAQLQEMFSETLYTTRDSRKLALNDWYGEGPLAKQAGGEFKFSDLEAWTQQSEVSGQVPLGGTFDAMKKSASVSIVAKDVLDTTSAGGGLLIPQGIIPQLYVWFSTDFPLWDQVPKVPANGVLHSWRNLIDLGDANDGFIDEFGCPPSGRGVYTVGNTNIAVLALKRGASLKLELLAQQVGFRYDGLLPSEIEVKNAYRSRAKIAAICTYQGTTASGHTGGDEYGITFANGYNGVRGLLANRTIANGINPNFYPTGYSPIVYEQAVGAGAGSTPIADALDAAVADVFNHGGRPNTIHITTATALKLKKEQASAIRFTMTEAREGLMIGAQVKSFMSAVVGEIPFTIIPDSFIGTYPVNGIVGNGGATNLTAGGNAIDAYVFSTDELAFPYIGSPDPIPLELPVGIPSADGTGCLSRELIIYQMFGFAMYNPMHQAKVRILQ